MSVGRMWVPRGGHSRGTQRGGSSVRLLHRESGRVNLLTRLKISNTAMYCSGPSSIGRAAPGAEKPRAWLPMTASPAEARPQVGKLV